MSNHVRAKKHYGQNFLNDKNIIIKIINVAQIQNQEVLEIGPGTGALTEHLVKHAKNVLAFEIDKEMIGVLNAKIKSLNFTLVNLDFLKADLSWEGKKCVVSNLPYYITSKILFKIFENIKLFSSLTIMVQKEVADRMVAKVNTKDYGKLSIVAQYYATIQKEFSVPPQSFTPVPKVDSAVVSLKFDKILDLDSAKFLFFIKKSFSMKRKKLLNNWKELFSKEEIESVYQKFNLESNVRPQEISLEQYRQIFLYISEKMS